MAQCTIPCTLNGEEKNYVPDFIASIGDGHGPADFLNLIVEVTGEKKKDKAAKVAAARMTSPPPPVRSVFVLKCRGNVIFLLGITWRE